MVERSAEERALYAEFRRGTEGEPLVSSLRNAVWIFAALQTFVFIPADALLFPDHFKFFCVARMLENALLAAVYFGTARRWPVASSAAVMFSGSALFLAMVHVTGGVESGYYVGLILLVIGMGVLAPLTGRQAGTIAGVIFAAYALVPFASEGDGPVAWSTFIQHAFFLGTACVESALACVHMDRMRYLDFMQKRELIRARDELADLDRAKSRFSANVHHELRTPLTLILAPLDAMRGGEFGALPDAIRSTVDTMHSNGRRLYKMINNLLDLSKLENHQLAITRRPMRLESVIAELVDAAQPMAERKRVELSHSGIETLPLIHADPEAIEKVFVNLVGNALKFTEAGDRIVVGGAAEEGGVGLFVEDTGIGIPPDKLDSIFDRFAQVDGSATRRHEGTGIGLSLAQEMIRLHGGRIWAESAGEGRGARMNVWLPFGETDERAEEQVLQDDAGAVLGLNHSIESVESDLHLEAEGQGADDVAAGVPDATWVELERTADRSNDRDRASDGAAHVGNAPLDAPEVLIAEDNPDMRALLAMLVGRRYRVRTARNGREGLELLRAQRPDLVLSDVMMPEMSGTEFCSAIKTDPETSAIPVVLVTSKAENEMKIEGLELGADDYVTKPFHPRELMARIDSLIRVSTLQTALSSRNEALERALEELKQAEVQLVQNEKMAAVGELAAGIAHEVNNPVNFALNAVRAMQQTVLELRELMPADPSTTRSAATDKQRPGPHEGPQVVSLDELIDDLDELAGIVGEGLNRTHALVADLRDFAVPGKRNGARVPVVLADGLRSTLNLLGPSLASAGARVHLEVGKDLPPVVGDPGALNQVILNLVKNASQAMAPAGGQISIRLMAQHDGLHLSVSDEGPGVPEDARSRLFEPFYTTKDPGEGTGLGLAISRQIVVDHGGDLTFESAPGEGARFVVRLPVAS